MKSGTTSHPKFRSLQRRLGKPQYAVVGILESVWMMAAQFADDGDLSRFTADEIADAVGWDGDPDELLETLVEYRWLDKNKSQLIVHDWAEHCPRYVADRNAKRRKRAADRPSSENVADSRRHSQSVAKNRCLPNPTQPIPTQPNQKSHGTSSATPSDGAAIKDHNPDEQTARWMFDRVKIVAPRAAKPTFSEWANTIRLMRERDHVDDAEIRSMFAWANEHDFWATNVLSPKALRKNFATMDAQRQKVRRGDVGSDPMPESSTPVSSIAERRAQIAAERNGAASHA